MYTNSCVNFISELLFDINILCLFNFKNLILFLWNIKNIASSN